MRMLLGAAVTASIALILVGFIGAQTPEPVIGPAPVTAPVQPADDAATSLTLLERQPDLVPHLFANECFMAVAYKRYQIPPAALDDTYAAAGNLDAYFVDISYVATDQRCPGTEAARTARSTPRLQAVE